MLTPSYRKIVKLCIIMIAFSVIEILAGLYFIHKYNVQSIYIYVLIALDILYIPAGLLLLTLNKRAAALSIILLSVVIVGRVALITTHLYPFSAIGPGIAMIAGILIAGAFIFYLWLQLDRFN
jgi:hypothetical protein